MSINIDFVRANAMTKAFIVLRDDSKKYYFSLDKKKDRQRLDYVPGMRALIRRIIEGKHKNEFKVATIYENCPGGRMIAQWDENGNRIK